MNIPRITTYLAPALLLGLLFFACKKTEPEKPAASLVPPERMIVATINGDPITLAEFSERFARAGYKADPETGRELKEDFLNRLIERTMMLREAQRKRIKISHADIENRIATFRAEHGRDIKEELKSHGVDFEKWKSDVWEDLMIERLLEREVHRQTSVSPGEVRRYYQANPAEFEKPEQVRVRQIVVDTEAEAKKAMELVQASGADFAAIARKTSTAPEAATGGDLGYFAMGDMPGEFNVVFGLPKHGVSGIVKSPYGYHIFKLVDKRGAGKISFAEASKEITEKLRRAKEDRQYKQWLKQLRARTKFEVNYKALE